MSRQGFPGARRNPSRPSAAGGNRGKRLARRSDRGARPAARAGPEGYNGLFKQHSISTLPRINCSGTGFTELLSEPRGRRECVIIAGDVVNLFPRLAAPRSRWTAMRRLTRHWCVGKPSSFSTKWLLACPSGIAFLSSFAIFRDCDTSCIACHGLARPEAPARKARVSFSSQRFRITAARPGRSTWCIPVFAARGAPSFIVSAPIPNTRGGAHVSHESRTARRNRRRRRTARNPCRLKSGCHRVGLEGRKRPRLR